MGSKIVFILLKLPLILIVLLLSVGNAHVVPFHVIPFGIFGETLTVEAPLFLLGFLFFVLGALFGVLSSAWRRRCNDKRNKTHRKTSLLLNDPPAQSSPKQTLFSKKWHTPYQSS